MTLEQLVLEPFRHAAHYADDNSLALSLLQAELVNPAPYPLLGIVPYRAGIGKYDICLINVLSKGIPLILKDGQYDLTVIDIHLASVCLYINLWPFLVYYWPDVRSVHIICFKNTKINFIAH